MKARGFCTLIIAKKTAFVTAHAKSDYLLRDFELVGPCRYKPRIRSSCQIALTIPTKLPLNKPFDFYWFISIIHESPVQLGRRLKLFSH
jgi:hypothetical protein